MFIQEKLYTLTFPPIGNYSAFDAYDKKKWKRIDALYIIQDMKLTIDIWPDTLLLYYTFRYLDRQLGKGRGRGSLW